jgi:hypothetical protein
MLTLGVCEASALVALDPKSRRGFVAAGVYKTVAGSDRPERGGASRPEAGRRRGAAHAEPAG